MSETVFFVRHGRTAWNAQQRYLGRTEIDLDDVGQAQAVRLARWAADVGVGAVFSSPARRAVSTAEAIAGSVGVPVVVDDRLRELDFGVAEGRTLAELRRTVPAVVEEFEIDPAAHHFPGGEPPSAAVQRFASAVNDAVGGRADRTLFVCHNTLLRLYLCAITGVPLAGYRKAFAAVGHDAYTELSHTEGRLRLERFNAPAIASSRSMEGCSQDCDEKLGLTS